MKPTIFLAITMAFVATNAEAALTELIQQNFQESNKFYEQTISSVEVSQQPLRLWIHIRTQDQKNIVSSINNAIAKIKISGNSVQSMPIQIVSSGPSENQLRFFKKENKENAKEIFNIIRQHVPTLKLIDFTSEYANAHWMKAGHFELWLSTN